MCKRKNKVNSRSKKSNEKKFFLSFSVFGSVPVVSLFKWSRGLEKKFNSVQKYFTTLWRRKSETAKRQ